MNPFTIRIFVPEGDPEGVRIVDRLSSAAKFFAFPRGKWADVRERPDMKGAGVYILIGYTESSPDLPTIYVGQADVLRNRMDQHIKGKEFWDKAVAFTSSNINSTHAKWLEYALIRRLNETKRSVTENGTNPQEPTISEAERAEMQVLLTEIYQTLPLVGLLAFEPVSVITPQQNEPAHISTPHSSIRDTVVVPAQEDGFKRVFLGENSWYAIRIGGGMFDKIKYVAAYQIAPISAITYYAEVKNIEEYGEEGKYKLTFKAPATKLSRPIPFDLPQGAMQGPRYTTFHKLTKAAKMSELF